MNEHAREIVIAILLFILIVLFAGTPDLMDVIIEFIKSHNCKP